MNGKDAGFLKVAASLIGVLLTICGVLLLIGFSSHSDADLQDREEIKTLSTQASKLETSLQDIKEGIVLIRNDVRDMKIYLFTGAMP